MLDFWTIAKIVCLATLEFKHALMVRGHHIKAASQPQSRTNKSRFEHHFLLVDIHLRACKSCLHGVANVVEVIFCFVKIPASDGCIASQITEHGLMKILADGTKKQLLFIRF